MPIEVTIQKARQARECGDIPRALLILRSSIPNYGYSIQLLEAYGDTLFASKNIYQAGRFLFVSCKHPTPEQLECIQHFLAKHKGDTMDHLVYSLPKVAQFEKLAIYPEFVQERLKALGAEDILFRARETPSTRLFEIGCFGLICIILFFTIIGVVTVIKWLLP